MKMDAAKTYEPESGYVEVEKDPLIEHNASDSTELWLIQWPKNQVLSVLLTTPLILPVTVSCYVQVNFEVGVH